MVTAKFGINCYKKDDNNKKISKQDKEKKQKRKALCHSQVTFTQWLLFVVLFYQIVS